MGNSPHNIMAIRKVAVNLQQTQAIVTAANTVISKAVENGDDAVARIAASLKTEAKQLHDLARGGIAAETANSYLNNITGMYEQIVSAFGDNPYSPDLSTAINSLQTSISSFNPYTQPEQTNQVTMPEMVVTAPPPTSPQQINMPGMVIEAPRPYVNQVEDIAASPGAIQESFSADDGLETRIASIQKQIMRSYGSSLNFEKTMSARREARQIVRVQELYSISK